MFIYNLIFYSEYKFSKGQVKIMILFWARVKLRKYFKAKTKIRENLKSPRNNARVQ